MTEQTIPVVDLADLRGSGPAQERATQALGDGLRELGFFALVGHDIGSDRIDELYGLAQRFYDLPDETKQAYERPELLGQRGFTSFGRERAKDSEAADLKEYLSIGPQEGGDGLPDNLWPAEVPELRDSALSVYASLKACAEATLEACARYAGLEERRFADLIEGGDTLLRILHYPPIPPDHNPASVRAAAHEDINLITLLCGATAEGLQLLNRDGEWLPIHAVPGQIIIDTGDMMQRLTNGFFRSTTHRVINPDDDRSRRFSMPFFVHPQAGADLTPIPECVAQTGGQPRFEPITAEAYLQERLQELGLGEAPPRS